jgi:hypothetical protein
MINMNTPKHTPGPWQVGGGLISGSSGEHSCEAVALVLRRPAVYGGKRYDTRDTDHAAPELGKTTDANARLIAAAPDLLKALKELFDLLEEHEPSWYLKGHFNRTRAALAKAEEL